MKKSNRKFNTEYGIYKKTGRQEVYHGHYIYEYTLVKRGFYLFHNARSIARMLRNSDGHFYTVDYVKERGRGFWEDYFGNVVFLDGQGAYAP